jgi:8-oxo-dGTP pyrophosphatase MutT (NUDIX family)
MERSDLLDLLDAYQSRFPAEAETIDRIRRLLTDRKRAFYRDCFDPGHITSSAWIISAESGAALLTHHRKLERWLQLGGHVDGEADVVSSALREAEEESGLEGFEVLPEQGGPVILDVDVHVIPARGDEPAHEHHDIRFLLRVSEDQPIHRQVEESKEVRWFPADGLLETFDEESLLRMVRKAGDWFARDPLGPA